MEHLNQRIITHVADLKSAVNVFTPNFVALYPQPNGLITTPTSSEHPFYWSECRALMSLFQFSLECGIFQDLESTYLYLNLHLKMLEKDAEFLYYEN